jgi:hypothetical protein
MFPCGGAPVAPSLQFVREVNYGFYPCLPNGDSPTRRR